MRRGSPAEPLAALPSADKEQRHQAHHVQIPDVDNAQHDHQRPQHHGIAVPVSRIIRAHRRLRHASAAAQQSLIDPYIRQIVRDAEARMPKVVGIPAHHVPLFRKHADCRSDIIADPFVGKGIGNQHQAGIQTNGGQQQRRQAHPPAQDPLHISPPP